MTINLSPLVHIEIVVHDAEAVYLFLNRVFGAQKVEEEFAASLEKLGGLKKIIHVDLGGTVLQLIEPGDFGTWGRQLREQGPGVHNITFRVDHISEVLKACRKEGVEILAKLPVDLKPLYGPDTPAPEESNACIIDTMEKIGFRLELFHKPQQLDKYENEGT